MEEYTYEYDPAGDPPDEHGRHDEATRTLMQANVDRSHEMDYNGSRRRMALTTEQLRRRVEGEIARRNGEVRDAIKPRMRYG